MSTYLTRKEKQIGLALLAVSAIAYFAIWYGPVFKHEFAKGSNPLLYLGGGLAMMVVATIGVLKARRAIAGALCMIVAFGPWGKYIVFPFPLLAFGAFTAFKKDPEAMARRRAEVQKRKDEKASGKSSGSRNAGRTVTDATGRSIPQSSKRYTPPARTRAKGRRSS